MTHVRRLQQYASGNARKISPDVYHEAKHEVARIGKNRIDGIVPHLNRELPKQELELANNELVLLEKFKVGIDFLYDQKLDADRLQQIAQPIRSFELMSAVAQLSGSKSLDRLSSIGMNATHLISNAMALKAGFAAVPFANFAIAALGIISCFKKPKKQVDVFAIFENILVRHLQTVVNTLTDHINLAREENIALHQETRQILIQTLNDVIQIMRSENADLKVEMSTHFQQVFHRLDTGFQLLRQLTQHGFENQLLSDLRKLIRTTDDLLNERFEPTSAKIQEVENALADWIVNQSSDPLLNNTWYYGKDIDISKLLPNTKPALYDSLGLLALEANKISPLNFTPRGLTLQPEAVLEKKKLPQMDVKPEERAIQNSRLWDAIQKNNTDEAKLAITAGAEIEGRVDGPYRGYTPLLLAAHFGRVEMVKHLLELGADVSAKNYDDANIVHLSVWNNCVPVLTLLKKYFPVLLSQMVNEPAAKSGNVTPLCFASENNALSAAEFVMQLGANRAHLDSNSQTPDEYATNYKKTEGGRPQLAELIRTYNEKKPDEIRRKIETVSNPEIWLASTTAFVKLRQAHPESIWDKKNIGLNATIRSGQNMIDVIEAFPQTPNLFNQLFKDYQKELHSLSALFKEHVKPVEDFKNSFYSKSLTAPTLKNGTFNSNLEFKAMHGPSLSKYQFAMNDHSYQVQQAMVDEIMANPTTQHFLSKMKILQIARELGWASFEASHDISINNATGNEIGYIDSVIKVLYKGYQASINTRYHIPQDGGQVEFHFFGSLQMPLNIDYQTFHNLIKTLIFGIGDIEQSRLHIIRDYFRRRQLRTITEAGIDNLVNIVLSDLNNHSVNLFKQAIQTFMNSPDYIAITTRMNKYALLLRAYSYLAGHKADILNELDTLYDASQLATHFQTYLATADINTPLPTLDAVQATFNRVYPALRIKLQDLTYPENDMVNQIKLSLAALEGLKYQPVIDENMDLKHQPVPMVKHENIAPPVELIKVINGLGNYPALFHKFSRDKQEKTFSTEIDNFSNQLARLHKQDDTTTIIKIGRDIEVSLAVLVSQFSVTFGDSFNIFGGSVLVLLSSLQRELNRAEERVNQALVLRM